MKSTVSKSLKAIKDNFYHYLIGIAIAEVTVLLMKRIVRVMLKYGLNKGHLFAITSDNYREVLKQPIVILTLLVVLFFTVLFVIVQFAILIRMVADPYKKERFTLKSIPRFIKRLLSTDLLLIIPYVFMIIPNMNFAMSITYVSQFHLPEFIVSSIMQNSTLLVIYLAGNALFFYLNIRLIFTPIIFVMNSKVRFLDAIKESWNLTRKSILRIVSLIFISWAITMIVSTLILFGIPAISSFLEMQFPNISTAILSAINALALVLLVIAISIWMILSIQMIVIRYYETIGDDVKRVKTYDKKGLSKKLVLVGISGFYLIVFGYLYFDLGRMEEPSSTLIISHRAESSGTVENTIEALEKVHQYKPDFVEIDVQITKDNEIVVFHDFSTKRLGSKNVKIKDATLAELKEITLSQNDATSTIPTFEEFVSKAKSLNQKLLVEFKGETFDNPLLTEEVVDILEKYRMFEMSAFQSLDKKTIVEFEKKYPSAETGFILGINFGELEVIDVDFYAMEDSSISNTVIDTVIDNDKGLLVWTINDDLRLRYYFMSYISGVITDDVEYANEVKEEVYQLSSFEILVYELMR